MTLKRFSKFAQLFLHPGFLKILIIINILGSIYGYYWYRGQLAATPVKHWLFVPDSPLSTTLFALAIIFLLYQKRKVLLLSFLAFITVIKYGFWAVFVNTHYWLLAGQIHWVEVMLWLSHLGMAVQGIIYLIIFPPALWEWGVVSIWLVINDYVDYAWGLHPYLYLAEQLSVVQPFTFCLTAVLIITSLLLIRRVRR